MGLCIAREVRTGYWFQRIFTGLKIGSRVIVRYDSCFFVHLRLPDVGIPRHQRFSLALWLTLLGCTLLVAATATSQEVEPTPTAPEAEPTPISPEAEPTTIPELEPAAPAVSPPETGAEGAPELSEEVRSEEHTSELQSLAY